MLSYFKPKFKVQKLNEIPLENAISNDHIYIIQRVLEWIPYNHLVHLKTICKFFHKTIQEMFLRAFNSKDKEKHLIRFLVKSLIVGKGRNVEMKYSESLDGYGIPSNGWILSVIASPECGSFIRVFPCVKASYKTRPFGWDTNIFSDLPLENDEIKGILKRLPLSKSNLDLLNPSNLKRISKTQAIELFYELFKCEGVLHIQSNTLIEDMIRRYDRSFERIFRYRQCDGNYTVIRDIHAKALEVVQVFHSVLKAIDECI